MELVDSMLELLDEMASQFDKLTQALLDIKSLLPTYFLLVLIALFPLYTGSHASLTRPSSAAKPKRTKKSAKKDDDDDDAANIEEKVQRIEGLTPVDALIFPLAAAVVLSSLYFLIKWMEDPAFLNKILNWYLATCGLWFLTVFLNDSSKTIRSFLFPIIFSQGDVLAKVDAPNRKIDIVNSPALSGRFDDSDDDLSLKDTPTPEPTTPSSIHPPLRLKLWSLRDFLYKKVEIRFYVYPLVALKSKLDAIDVSMPFLAVAILLYFNLVSKAWPLINLLGFAFSYNAMQQISPTTFFTGSLILGALFVYDVVMVFYTPMMITVATTLEVPIKLVIPRPGDDEEQVKLAMLGLGDIVIPGMIIALALRFDLFMFYLRKQVKKSDLSAPDDKSKASNKTNSEKDTKIIKLAYKSSTGRWGERFWTSHALQKVAGPFEGCLFPKPYFHAGMVGYVIGMVITTTIMHIYQHGQPALLYLVPSVLGALWGRAWWRAELAEMWNFTEEDTEGDGSEVEKKKIDNEREENRHDGWLAWLGYKSPKVNLDSKSSNVNDSKVNDVVEKKLKSVSKDSNTTKSSSKSSDKKNSRVMRAASKLIGHDISESLLFLSVSRPKAISREFISKSVSSSTDDQTTSSAAHDSRSHATSLEDDLRDAAESSLRSNDSSLPSPNFSLTSSEAEVVDMPSSEEEQPHEGGVNLTGYKHGLGVETRSERKRREAAAEGLEGPLRGDVERSAKKVRLQ